MGESNGDRVTRIEQMIKELTAQTSELHRLALVLCEPKAAATKPPKRRVRKKRV